MNERTIQGEIQSGTPVAFLAALAFGHPSTSPLQMPVELPRPAVSHLEGMIANG
jgi:hypothetical protein